MRGFTRRRTSTYWLAMAFAVERFVGFTVTRFIGDSGGISCAVDDGELVGTQTRMMLLCVGDAQAATEAPIRLHTPRKKSIHHKFEINMMDVVSVCLPCCSWSQLQLLEDSERRFSHPSSDFRQDCAQHAAQARCCRPRFPSRRSHGPPSHSSISCSV